MSLRKEGISQVGVVLNHGTLHVLMHLNAASQHCWNLMELVSVGADWLPQFGFS